MFLWIKTTLLGAGENYIWVTKSLQPHDLDRKTWCVSLVVDIPEGHSATSKGHNYYNQKHTWWYQQPHFTQPCYTQSDHLKLSLTLVLMWPCIIQMKLCSLWVWHYSGRRQGNYNLCCTLQAASVYTHFQQKQAMQHHADALHYYQVFHFSHLPQWHSPHLSSMLQLLWCPVGHLGWERLAGLEWTTTLFVSVVQDSICLHTQHVWWVSGWKTIKKNITLGISLWIWWQKLVWNSL